MEHVNIIPKKTFKWSITTLDMKFSEVEKYYDSFVAIGELPKTTVLTYHENTGRAFGVVIGKIRAASEILNK